MLMCYECALDERIRNIDPRQDPTSAASEVVAFLGPRSQIPPLDLLAAFFIKNPGLAHVARDLFGAYDAFVAILSDKKQRQHLEKLKVESIATDEVYQEARLIGHRFRDALNSLFFSDDANGLLALTKMYGVF